MSLTFHGAGDPALALALLDAAEAGGARITVFAVGTWLTAAGTDRVLQRLHDGGHELANHTYTHPALRCLSPAATLAEIIRCRDTLEQVAGQPGRFSARPAPRRPARRSWPPRATPATAPAWPTTSTRRTTRTPAPISCAAGRWPPCTPAPCSACTWGTAAPSTRILDGLTQRGLRAITASALIPL